MREILFRGKRVDNGEWVEGYFCGKVSKNFFGVAEDSTQIIDKNLWWHEVIPETVGQYTGLTDKTGKMVFEGDIVEGIAFSSNHRGTIEWITQIAGFGVRYWNNHIPTAWENSSILKQMTRGRTDEFAAKVIGNIYDNPELLKGEK